MDCLGVSLDSADLRLRVAAFWKTLANVGNHYCTQAQNTKRQMKRVVRDGDNQYRTDLRGVRERDTCERGNSYGSQEQSCWTDQLM